MLRDWLFDVVFYYNLFRQIVSFVDIKTLHLKLKKKTYKNQQIFNVLKLKKNTHKSPIT